MLPAIIVGVIVVWAVRTVKKKRKQEKLNKAWRDAQLPKSDVAPGGPDGVSRVRWPR